MADPQALHRLPLPDLAGLSRPLRLLIVVAAPDAALTEALLVGARGMAARVSAEVEVLEVPGILEIPPAVALAERLAEFDGYAALGLRLGQGPADLQALAEVGRALMALNLGGACIGQAVELAADRDAPGQGAGSLADKAGSAMAAALHLIAISRKWAGQTKGIGFRA